MKHYGSFLYDAGRSVKYKAEQIVSLLYQVQELEKKIQYYKSKIEEEEQEFLDFIKDDWNEEEINSAKRQAEENNKK